MIIIKYFVRKRWKYTQINDLMNFLNEKTKIDITKYNLYRLEALGLDNLFV